MTCIIQPLTKVEILEIFDKKAIEIINYYLKLNSFAHPESKENQDNIKFQTTKEHMEQWIVQALNAEPMGAGSYPVDIKTKEFLADVKSMSIKVDKNGSISNVESGETSLAQKFKEENLDNYFVNKQYDNIKNLWVDILQKKYKSVISKTDIGKIYYIFFMRANLDYYIFITKLNHSLITQENMQVNIERTTKDSVYINGMIDKNFGSVKIYKAKKRMELRLLPKYFIDNNYCYKLESLQYPEKQNMRKTNITEYIKEKIDKFFLFFI